MLYRRENEFDAAISAASATYGVSSALLKAVFANESGFDPSATGDAGRAFGIGQMWLSTAKGLGFGGTGADLLRAEIAIPLAAKYLGNQLVRYHGDQAAALSAYNAGHNMIPPSGPEAIANVTNRDYLRRGLIHLAYFSGGLGAPDAAAALHSGQWLRAAVGAVRANPVKSGAAVLLLLGVGLGLFFFLTRR